MDSDKKEQIITLKKTLRNNLILSAVIPLIIFYIFKHFNMTLDGIILSGSWGIAVVVVCLVKDHKINYLALLTAIFLAIGLIGTIISKNPAYFLVSPIITRAIWAAIFFTSLLFSKPLLQIIIESMVTVPEIVKNTKVYRQAWKILTVMWGIYQLTLAILLLILIRTVSVTFYFTIIAICNMLDILPIIFSIWFGRWYLTKNEVISTGK